MDKIITRDKKFLDQYGRERIFNGMNMCDKTSYSPGYIEHGFAKDLSWVDEFKNKGFNIIRLGMTWSVIEPEHGKYNDEYLNSIEKIMDYCHENGLYVYLDMHQDLYSGNPGNGDGAPAWATDSSPYKFKPTKFVWAEGYFWGKAEHRAFDNFWTNKTVDDEGLIDSFGNMWAHVAERFKDHPALFGFDVFNEPFLGKDGGTVFKKMIANLVKATLTDKRIKKGKLIKDALGKEKIKVLEHYTGDVFHSIVCVGEKLVRKFDEERYMPFLNKMAKKIREITDNGILFIEHSYYSNLGIPTSNDAIIIDGKREENQCYSPHGYDLMVDTELYKYASNSRTDSIFSQCAITQEKMQNAVLVGEWGGHSPGTDWFPHVCHLIDFFDAHKWSSTYWAYWDGFLSEPVMSLLSRPYPKAVTGNIEAYKHDREKDEFTLTYTQNDDFDVPTVIYAHKEVKEIITDGKVKQIPLADGSSDIEIKTGKGHHSITLKF